MQCFGGSFLGQSILLCARIVSYIGLYTLYYQDISKKNIRCKVEHLLLEYMLLYFFDFILFHIKYIVTENKLFILKFFLLLKTTHRTTLTRLCFSAVYSLAGHKSRCRVIEVNPPMPME